MAMHLKGNSRPVNQSIFLNAHSLEQSQWWVLSLCYEWCFTCSDFYSIMCNYLRLSLCRSVLSLCWVSSTGAGPPWFWVWRSCEGWRAFSTQPPCLTWRDCALLARAASACSGSTSVRSSPLPVGTQRSSQQSVNGNIVSCKNNLQCISWPEIWIQYEKLFFFLFSCECLSLWKTIDNIYPYILEWKMYVLDFYV